MPAGGQLVYKLDEIVAPGGAPQVLHIVFGDVDTGGSIRPLYMVFAGRTYRLSFDEFALDWAERYRKEYSPSGHGSELVDKTTSGQRDETESPYWEKHQGGTTPRLDCTTKVYHPGVRISESIQQGKISRGNDSIYYGFVGSSPNQNSYKGGQFPNHTATGVLYSGRINESLVAGHAPEQRGGGGFSPEVLHSEGGSQEPEDCGPPETYVREATRRVRETQRSNAVRVPAADADDRGSD